MTQRVHIRVTLEKDGKTARRELVVDGENVTDLSYVETLELAMNATSTLRYDGPMNRMARAFD